MKSKRPIVYRDDALDDLDNIADYYFDERAFEVAINLPETIRERLKMLSDHPAAGKAGRIAGTREMVLVGTPYLAVYRMANNRVEVLRVLHGAQQWPAEGHGM